MVGWKDSNAAQHGTVEAPEAPKEEASVAQCGNAVNLFMLRVKTNMSWRHVNVFARLNPVSAMFLAGSGWRVLLVEIVGAVHSEEGNSHGLMWRAHKIDNKIDNCMQLITIDYNIYNRMQLSTNEIK